MDNMKALRLLALILVTGAAQAMAQTSSEMSGQADMEAVVSQGEGDSATSAGVPADFFETAGNQAPIASKRVYETAGFIGARFDSYGMILAGEREEQVSFSYSDIVYINRSEADGVKPGSKYLVFHPAGEVTHPVTEVSLGNKVAVDGVIEVVEVEDKVSKAKVISSYDFMQAGYKIKPLEDVKTPTVDPDRPVQDKKLTALILDGKDSKVNYSKGDVIYLDAGSKTGVTVGDIFEAITQVDVSEPEADDNKRVSAPKVNALIRILSVESDTSTGLIISSVHYVMAGQTVRFAPLVEAGLATVTKREKSK
ncbi:MAG: hypothetical protein HY751_00655 [Nitrospinae bacterium]|nr:hypothetical protein [Nitrospinota bacterium]